MTENEGLSNEREAGAKMERETHRKLIGEVVGDIYATRRKVMKNFEPCRERSLVLTKLDEAAMWARNLPIDMERSVFGAYDER